MILQVQVKVWFMQCTKGDEFCYQTAWLLNINVLWDLSRAHTSYQAGRSWGTAGLPRLPTYAILSQSFKFCPLSMSQDCSRCVCCAEKTTVGQNSAEMNISWPQFDECVVSCFDLFFQQWGGSSDREGSSLLSLCGRPLPILSWHLSKSHLWISLPIAPMPIYQI